MKVLAVSLIALCFSLMGFSVSYRLENRISKLEKIGVFLSDIKSRIQFTADCAADVFSSLNSTGNYTILPFVRDCATKLQNGESFDLSWQYAVSQKNNILGLKKEDVAILLSFGAAFGVTDTAGQISNCEVHEKLIEAKLGLAKKDFSLYSKPAKGIGVLAGLAVVILSL